MNFSIASVADLLTIPANSAAENPFVRSAKCPNTVHLGLSAYES